MAKPKLREMPDLTAWAEPGADIWVKATPKAASDRIVMGDGTLYIHVTAVPEGGKANDAVRRILAAAMRVAPSALILKRGQTARNKVFTYVP